ncbi:hypothetical protein SAY87_017765 [Trapa incisa]|uniref:Uncharacterized protein n=1 Tax=Trapa incisa TaxID=236973 RepID=A0AAN7L745_9MYRT|nr:hypothetical protein SAY87_017765 [Trapa incisa]
MEGPDPDEQGKEDPARRRANGSGLGNWVKGQLYSGTAGVVGCGNDSGFQMNPVIDLDWLGLGCVSFTDKHGHDPVLDEEEGSPVPSPSADMVMSTASMLGKSSKMIKETHQSTNYLGKISSQIRKPSRRKTSPVNRYPGRRWNLI